MQGGAAVAAGHPRVVQAATDVLSADGNAYDAWIAAVATACICEPVLTSLGGGGFLLAAPADGRPVVIDFFTQTPQQRPPIPEELDFRAFDAQFGTETQEFWIGWGTTAVPGVVAGIFEVHRRFGRMPLREILTPAIQAANEGVAVSEAQAGLFQVVKAAFLSTAESRALFGSARTPGEILAAGETLRFPEFADVLDCLAAEGPDLFYRGEIAAALLEASRDAGVLQRADLESYSAEMRAPLSTTFEGAQILINPPPAAGGLLASLGLSLLDGAGLGALHRNDDAHARLVAKAIGRTVDIEAQEGWDPEEGGADPVLLARWREEIRNLRFASQGTTHASIIDRHGNVASATVSNGSGSGCIIPGTGIMVNNMLGEAELNPGGFHAWPLDQRLTWDHDGAHGRALAEWNTRRDRVRGIAPHPLGHPSGDRQSCRAWRDSRRSDRGASPPCDGRTAQRGGRVRSRQPYTDSVGLAGSQDLGRSKRVLRWRPRRPRVNGQYGSVWRPAPGGCCLDRFGGRHVTGPTWGTASEFHSPTRIRSRPTARWSPIGWNPVGQVKFSVQEEIPVSGTGSEESVQAERLLHSQVAKPLVDLCTGQEIRPVIAP